MVGLYSTTLAQLIVEVIKTEFIVAQTKHA